MCVCGCASVCVPLCVFTVGAHTLHVLRQRVCSPGPLPPLACVGLFVGLSRGVCPPRRRFLISPPRPGHVSISEPAGYRGGSHVKDCAGRGEESRKKESREEENKLEVEESITDKKVEEKPLI